MIEAYIAAGGLVVFNIFMLVLIKRQRTHHRPLLSEMNAKELREERLMLEERLKVFLKECKR